MLSKLLDRLEDIGRMTLGVLGVIIATLSTFVITYASIELTAPGFQIGAVLYALLASATLMALAGGLLLWRSLQGAGEHREQRRREQRQQDILELAEELGGRVTVAEIALKLSYTVDEVREQLEAFVDSGIAEPGVSESGREVYLFPEFWNEQDKLTAQDPMSREFEAIFGEDEEVALSDLEESSRDRERVRASRESNQVDAETARTQVDRDPS